MPAQLNLKGQTFDRLTVTSQAESRGGKTYWHCLCECGGEAVVQGVHLKLKLTRSCGCLFAEANRVRATTHGGTGTPEYVSWLGMKWRCSPDNRHHRPHYFDKGIYVCDRWKYDFVAFRDDMPPYPGGDIRWTVDRVDNHDIYRPGNCQWATQAVQNANRG